MMGRNEIEVHAPVAGDGEDRLRAEDTLAAHRRNLDRLSELIAGCGMTVRRGGPASWARLMEYAPAARDAIVRSLALYVDVCEDCVREGKSLSDDRWMLWRFLGRQRLRSADDLFDKISSGDVIEVYDERALQIFRNLAFFEVSSYSLEDLLHYPMYELFERDPACTRALLREVEDTLKGVRATSRSEVPRHPVREIFSYERLRAVADQKYLSPLRDSSGDVRALVATVRLRITDTSC